MNKPIPFDGLFAGVQLLDKPEAMRLHSVEAFERQALVDHFGRDKDSKPQDALEVVKNTTHLYVLGKPGAGKTTFLKHLLRYTLEDMPEMVPFFVSLKEWSEQSGDLETYLMRQLEIGGQGFAGADGFLKQTLDAGHAMVLLDGLDEVNLEANRRSKIVELIKAFCKAHRNNRFVLTCRVAAHEYNFEHFQYVQVADFSPNQIKIFVNRWFSEKPESGETLLGELQKPGHAGYLELAGVPLLLTLLCVGFEEANEFPKRKSEVYSNALAALLLKWDNSKNITRGKASYKHYKQLSLERKHQLFEKIAHDWFVKGKIFFETAPLAKQIETYLDKIPAKEREDQTIPTIGVGADILQAIEEQHAILIPRSRDVHSFAHLTFQEYYTARYFAQHPTESNFRNLISHAIDPKWHEVLLLTVSEFSEGNTSFFLQTWKLFIENMLKNKKLNSALFFKNQMITKNQKLLIKALLYTQNACFLAYEYDHDLMVSLENRLEVAVAFRHDLNAQKNLEQVLQRYLPYTLFRFSFDLDRLIDQALLITVSEFRNHAEIAINRIFSELAFHDDYSTLLKSTGRLVDHFQTSKMLTDKETVKAILELITTAHRSYKDTKLSKNPEYVMLVAYQVLNQGKRILYQHLHEYIENLLEGFEVMYLTLLELIPRSFKIESHFKADLEQINLISRMRTNQQNQALKDFKNICNQYLNNIFVPLDHETSDALTSYLEQLAVLNVCLEHMAIDKQTRHDTQSWFFTQPT